MNKPEIAHFDASAEFYTEERCYIIEFLNEGSEGVSIARARVEPGVTTAWHRLAATVERYVIEAGRGRVEVGQLPPTEVGPGDTVVIPAGERQRITNTGTDDLLFLCICSPGFRATNYESLE
ncbi:cupin domain-containing protein [candidate division GN15 bacterium]|nr:cupin domain-containing protein [candidate division GN15 bacterium]